MSNKILTYELFVLICQNRVLTYSKISFFFLETCDNDRKRYFINLIFNIE